MIYIKNYTKKRLHTIEKKNYIKKNYIKKEII